ncbi:hypothetical protein GDO81_007957 [Engystomops pustulosus]|uniref:Uncharacterized protein n=1 Tax=Engystomops pustulosus TaxID=76066 RepID=A0AAV7CCP9_ENGPU|nr:hypothetical protein GDO81_007957 [Engystomops pustulosus]
MAKGNQRKTGAPTKSAPEPAQDFPPPPSLIEDLASHAVPSSPQLYEDMTYLPDGTPAIVTPDAFSGKPEGIAGFIKSPG